MLIVIEHNTSGHQTARVVCTIKEMGYDARPIPGGQRTAVGLIGNDEGGGRLRWAAGTLGRS